MISLIALLGNPGREYAHTRHNIAWMVEPHLSFSGRLNWQEKFKSLTSTIALADRRLILLKPQTLMNRSGDSVQSAAHFFKIPPEEILVVHDDLELEFGWIAWRRGGGLAGHNGLRSIAERLASRDFSRFRLGISRPVRGNTADYVLSPFSKSEQNDLDCFLVCAAQRLEKTLLSDEPLPVTANKINCL
ncbi:MAG TPA: aminoacyl-tRNA hydrolase [bacterium]|nr:aminoacyl-tRNA hydrolase [bacterium]HOX84782.1 aminoacyl-tRNA hydrolase [bacterium]HPG45505.1 aminoacyl-tRNA hydrolase [bacterium]HPM96719.1 aminoacyl-tRNA hydrolase [bacterium]